MPEIRLHKAFPAFLTQPEVNLTQPTSTTCE